MTPLLCALTVFNLCCINSHALEYSFSYEFNGISSGYKLSSSSSYSFANYHNTNSLNLSSGTYDLIIGSTFNSLAYPGLSQLTLTIGLSESFTLTNDTKVRANFYMNDGKVIYSKSSSYFSKILQLDTSGTYSSVPYWFITWTDIDLSQCYKVDLYVDKINFTNSNNVAGLFYFRPASWNGAIISDSQVSDINNTLNSTPNGSINDVSQSEINSVDSKEQALVGTDVSTNDLNVSINPQASSVVWNLVDNAVTGNAKVFAMFISILTIGIIGLILNR